MSHYTLFEIHNLFELQFFSSLDYFFADSMSKAFDETDSIVLASCALVSKVLSEGHICLDIKKAADTVLSVSKTIDANLKFPGFDAWLRALENSSIVSKISGVSRCSGVLGTIETPLVLDSSHRLYFSKYFDFQSRLICNIAQRFFLKPLFMDETVVDEMINASFTGENKHISNQKKTVKNAVCNNFTVISGGPGTGKTFIISIIKNILLSYAAKQDLVKPKIICVAPTGKAASKMENGSTIHSILKPLKNSPGFYHNKNNPLLTDVIIIDEASMVDISLLTRLLEAVPFTAKVIMLGDKNQLSSIQAGSVFSDICSVKSLVTNIFFLEYNFRSKGKTGIENLSKAINNNDIENLEFILTSGQYSDIVFVPLNAPSKESFGGSGIPTKIVNKYILEGYKSFCSTDSIEAAFDKLDSFKILCAHNSGEYGTLQINNACEKILRLSHNSDIDKKPFKKIIMVNTNDYKKGLFNGDTGVSFENSFKNGFEISKKKEVFFKSLDNGLKQYRVLDLPDNDTAFAITIHKSQGSEFKTVLIILPDKLSSVVTRQLLYTGVTRAKAKVIVVGDLNIIKKAISLSVERNSGMTEYLANKIKSGKI
jgi:exodeoxyribonuclease V alpha subunit